MDNETSEVAYTDNQWSVYLNLCKEYRQDKSAPTIKTSFQEGKVCREKKEHSQKTIVIKRKWVFYNDLMEYIHNYADIR